MLVKDAVCETSNLTTRPLPLVLLLCRAVGCLAAGGVVSSAETAGVGSWPAASSAVVVSWAAGRPLSA